MFQILRASWIAAALCLVTAGAVHAGQSPRLPFGQSGPQPFVWWKSEVCKKELKLTTDQINRIDAIWETARLELKQEFLELSRLEEKLSRQIRHDADEATLSRQIDRVETARANANKTRSLMLVQMRKALSPEQRVQLDAIHARWAKGQEPLADPPARDPQKKPEED